ncbi:MAG TPA: hypothetical protein CFH81_00345 [Sulfurovum sp. UBA12169]|nr:MAG TPA: hypothetical protein CFH81_00345 [Sulfurovum sp. UBA12169]
MKTSNRYGSKVMLNKLIDGDVSYFIVYKTAGDSQNTWLKIGKRSEGITEAKCIEIRNQKLSEQRHGLDLSQKDMKRLTFGKLAESYFRTNAVHVKSIKQYQQTYKKHIEPHFGDIAVANLNDEDITDLQTIKIAHGLKKSTINGIIKLIVRLVNFGIKRGIIKYSPFRNIKHFKVSNTRLRYLSHEEIEHLRDMVNDDLVLKLFTAVALGTGARAEGVLAIQKKHINQSHKSITINDFKRGNTYVAYLDDDSFTMLVDHMKNMKLNHYVVSVNGKKTKYQTLYKKLKPFLEVFNDDLTGNDKQHRVVIHTLRHTFASHLAISGVSIQEIQKLLNHKDINQTLKYAKLAPDSGRDHVKKLYKGKR